jgi:hypothetical protein
LPVYTVFCVQTLKGFVKMKKGDTGAIYTLASGSSYLHMGESTGFSMALIHPL